MASYWQPTRISTFITGNIAPWNALDGYETRLKKFSSTASFALLVVISYYAGAKIGYALTPSQHSYSIFWPPNAILLGILLITPRQRWWIAILAVFPIHLFIQLHAGIPLSTTLGWFASNIAEALLGAYGIRRFHNTGVLFERVQGLIVFLAFGVIGAPLITSFLDAAVVVSTGWSKDYWILWTTRLFSNILGVLTLVPTIVMFSVNGVSWLRNAGLKRYIEVGLLAASILLAGTLVFGSTHMGRLNIPTLSYMPLPLLLWASLRFGAAGLSASLLGITLISTGYAVQGRGLFTSPSMITNVLSLQVLLCMITLPLMFLVAVLAERRITEQSLRESRVRLIDAQEQERHRIARELHDDVGQKLALLESELAQLGDESQMPRRPRLHELVDQVSDISKVTREISHGLRPSHLEHLGLIIAIRKLCRDFAQDSSLNINCTEVNVPEPLAFDISLSLYRIAQEALHNIEKHSHARSVSIELRGNARRLLLRIIDDGIGFDANSKRAEGLGIANMQERIASISGTFVIASAPMKGTRIEVRVPIVPTG